MIVNFLIGLMIGIVCMAVPAWLMFRRDKSRFGTEVGHWNEQLMLLGANVEHGIRTIETMRPANNGEELMSVILNVILWQMRIERILHGGFEAVLTESDFIKAREMRLSWIKSIYASRIPDASLRVPRNLLPRLISGEWCCGPGAGYLPGAIYTDRESGQRDSAVH